MPPYKIVEARNDPVRQVSRENCWKVYLRDLQRREEAVKRLNFLQKQFGKGKRIVLVGFEEDTVLVKKLILFGFPPKSGVDDFLSGLTVSETAKRFHEVDDFVFYDFSTKQENFQKEENLGAQKRLDAFLRQKKRSEKNKRSRGATRERYAKKGRQGAIRGDAINGGKILDK